MRLKPLSPLVRLTLALVTICAMMVLLADTLLDAFPNRTEQLVESRQQLGNGIAVQAASLLRRVDDDTLRAILEELRSRIPAARSLVLRRADGSVLVRAGAGPAEPGPMVDNEHSTVDRILVPLMASGQRWGRLEISFQPDPRAVWWQWLSEPMVSTMVMVLLCGSLIIGLYLRRALQHLDPRAVIPERVQGAFDVMNEGVVVLDAKGQVLLANKAMHGLHDEAAALRVGERLSAQAWLTAALPGPVAQHPWMRTLTSGAPVSGFALAITDGSGQPHALLVNTMPINDPGGKVRGCLVSFTDQTPVHKANAALQSALAELSRSKEQVQLQNQELLRLATRDPLTGCMNRRAFNEAYEPMFAQALQQGRPISVVMLDIDHFKRVNDSHGHGIGDRVIQEVARKLNDSSRGSDLVCRYGGEEFVLVLSGMDAAAAMAAAERVRVRIAEECGPAVREVAGMRVTVSLGVATQSPNTPHPVERAATLIDTADQALYRAKRGGRNRVMHADQPDGAADMASAAQADAASGERSEPVAG